ncbi:MAG: phosphatase PAP2 family protein, partial [Opitutaceae bacterium]|nr:phosphatase PAP2 family protein [Opitutaceae bacterium]
MKNPRIAPFIAALLFAISLGAAEPRFLTTAHEVFYAMLPPPPPDDSPAGLADIETILQVQKDRTPAQVERARRVEKQNTMSLGAWLFGPDFNKENLPRTYAFLRRASTERSAIIRAMKAQWSRPRPYDRGLGVEKCVPNRPAGTSYPSGHSSAGALWEVLFSAAMPEHETFFASARREIMWSRVLAGVHYPSDTQAGCLIGHAIARDMLKAPATRAALKEMRAEILAFLENHPQAALHAQNATAKKEG